MKDNKIIAEFMGYEIIYRPNSNGFIEISDTELCDVDDLEYHKSWYWLMPVISKITKDERYVENEYRESIMDVVPYGNIEDTIKTIVEFIKEYNQNN